MILLPAPLEAVRSATGQLDDQLLGEVLCKLKGVEFIRVSTDWGYIDIFGKKKWHRYRRDRAPDNSIDAALALAIERFGVERAMRILERATLGHGNWQLIPKLMIAGMLMRLEDAPSPGDPA